MARSGPGAVSCAVPVFTVPVFTVLAAAGEGRAGRFPPPRLRDFLATSPRYPFRPGTRAAGRDTPRSGRAAPRGQRHNGCPEPGPRAVTSVKHTRHGAEILAASVPI